MTHPDRIDRFSTTPFPRLTTVSSMAHSLTVPSSAKIRLCPAAKTTDLGRVLEHAGASWVTLHARHVSAKRRRQGAADLDAIRDLKQAIRIPVISNGNVRTFSDIAHNVAYTRADGVMVGETLLGNPWCDVLSSVLSTARVDRRARSVFEGGAARDPVHMALDYLEMCKCLEGVAALKTMQAHVRYMIEFQWCVHLRAGNPLFLDSDSELVGVGRGIRDFGSH